MPYYVCINRFTVQTLHHQRVSPFTKHNQVRQTSLRSFKTTIQKTNQCLVSFYSTIKTFSTPKYLSESLFSLLVVVVFFLLILLFRNKPEICEATMTVNKHMHREKSGSLRVSQWV